MSTYFGKRLHVQSIVIAACFGLLFATDTAVAQWQEEFCLRTGPDSVRTATSQARNIAAEGRFVHTVWSEKQDGKWRTCYRRSTDGGTSWEEMVPLSDYNTPWPRQDASIAVEGERVYAVWFDKRDGTFRVYFRHSLDHGEHWEAEQCLTPGEHACWFPSMAVSSGEVHVVWTENQGMTFGIRYRKSTDGAGEWSDPVTLAPFGSVEGPVITASASTIHLLWYEWTGGSDIFYRRSTDRGASWEKEVRLTDDPGYQNNCVLAVSGDEVHAVWHDRRTGFWDIHYCYSWDGGAHWGEDEPVMLTQYYCLFPTIAVAGQTLHLAWVDTRNDQGDIYYCRSDDAGYSWGPEEHVVSSPQRSSYPSLAVAGDAVHLLWTDYHTDLHSEIRYRGNPTGNTGTTASEDLVASTGYYLDQNYPNPFSSSSSMRFSIPAAAHVKITVHDLLGRTVQTVLDGERSAGTHVTTIVGTQLPPGSYLCRMQADDVMLSRMMTVLKN